MAISDNISISCHDEIFMLISLGSKLVIWAQLERMYISWDRYRYQDLFDIYSR